MASKAPATLFMDKLLAPLPESVEPVETKEFLCELRREREEAWRLVQTRMRLAEYQSSAAFAVYDIAKMEGASEERVASAYADYGRAERSRMAAIGNLMMTPIAKLGHLRWKEDSRKADGGRDEWEAQIVADREWLAGRA